MKEKESLFHTFHRELRHMLRTHHAVCDGRLSALGIHPAQHMLLMHLGTNREIRSQKELAAHMHISPAALAVSLGKLEAGAYIARETSSADNRVKALAITARGEQMLTESRCIFDSIDQETFAGVSEEEMRATIATLRKMHENLARMKEKEEGK